MSATRVGGRSLEDSLPLIERDECNTILDGLLAGGLHNQRKVALVSGPVGTGKTSVLQALTERARARSMDCLVAACSPAERALPLGVFTQLLRGVLPSDELAHLIDRAHDEAVAVPGDQPAVAEPDHAVVEAPVARVLQELCLTLLDLAGARPLLIAIDDIQFADHPSLLGLLSLIRRLPATRTVVVITETVPPRPPYSPLHAELLHHPHCRHLRLKPLSDNGVRRMLTARFDEATAARLAAPFTEITGGNPRLVEALLHDQPTGVSTVDDAPVVTDGYARAVLGCLHRGGPRLVAVARGMVVLGELATTETLRHLLDLDAGVVDRAIEAMRAAGLVREGWFRHPAAAAAVRDDLPPGSRVELARRSARRLHELGSSPAAVAGLLLAAGELREPWVLPTLAEAAEQALGDDRLDFAVECLEQARRVAEPGERAAITARLAKAEWRSDPAVAARHLDFLVEAVRKGELGVQDGIVVVRQLLWHGRLDEAAEVLDLLRGAVAVAGPEAAGELRDTELWVASTYPPLARRRRVPTAEVKDTFAVASLGTDPGIRAASAVANLLAGNHCDMALSTAEQILRMEPLRFEGAWDDEPTMLALLTLVYGDRIREAASWCDEMLAEAARRRSPTWQAMFAGLRAEISVRQGDLPDAAEHARQAMTYLSPRSWGQAIGLPLGALIVATTLMGRLDEAAACLASPVPEAMSQSRFGLHYRYARGRYYLARGNHQAAVADFLSCGELMRVWGVDAPELVLWRVAAAEASLAHGNTEQARRLIDNQLARLGAERSRARGRALRVRAAVTAGPRQRLGILLEAAEILDSRGDQLNRALCLADLGRTFDRLGEQTRARVLVRQAWRLARECAATNIFPAPVKDPVPVGEPGQAREPARRAGSLGAGRAVPRSRIRSSPTGHPSLSQAERRVATLASAGYTNRQIARRLFITDSTVEQHLTRVYRKLNVKDRSRLPEVLEPHVATSA